MQHILLQMSALHLVFSSELATSASVHAINVILIQYFCRDINTLLEEI